MDDHEALVNSLGESCVTYIGVDNIRQLTARYDYINGVAHVEICLAEDTWPAREAAIDKMLEVREIFLDEVSVDYAFLSDGECQDAKDAQAEYAYA